MPILEDLRAFDLENSATTLWVFKKSNNNSEPRYNGRWVRTSDDLDAALKEAVAAERARIEEVQEYGLLAQNNEASALTIPADETQANIVLAECSAETQNKQVTKLREVQNAAFYVIKLVVGTAVIYAVKQSDPSWRTRRSRNVISAVFSDQQLGLETAPTFMIAKSIDFFIVGDALLISNKGKFESILQYKAAHQDDFTTLQTEPEFVAIFAELAPLVAFVANNKIHLRRVCAIRQKRNYADPNYMANLRAQHTALGFTFAFDAAGRIIATSEHCREIFQALLDHRLSSQLSQRVYDVPDAVEVGGA